jgi:hypothetical protein
MLVCTCLGLPVIESHIYTSLSRAKVNQQSSGFMRFSGFASGGIKTVLVFVPARKLFSSPAQCLIGGGLG